MKTKLVGVASIVNDRILVQRKALASAEDTPFRFGYNQTKLVPNVQQMFQVLSADLAARQPEAENSILCPLCMSRFTFDAISEHLVSVEHIIPSALGGKLEVITCTECNNAHGSAFEKHLVKAMHALDSLEGKIWIRRDCEAREGSEGAAGGALKPFGKLPR